MEILQAGAASLGEMGTFHLRGAIDGEVALDIGGTGGGAPLPVNGTTIDADVDVAAGELAVELLVPALLNARVDLVVVDGTAYLRAPIVTGDSWVKQPAEGGIGVDVGAAIDGLAAFLARPELAAREARPTRAARDRLLQRPVHRAGRGGPRRPRAPWGARFPGCPATPSATSTVTVGVRKDNLDLATLGLEIPAGGATPLTIQLELSKVNEPVTIEAPPADQVKDAPAAERARAPVRSRSGRPWHRR